jgi:hypothetical protein
MLKRKAIGLIIFAAALLAGAAQAAELIHNPVLAAAAGQDIQIQASLIGCSADSRVRLFYRPKGK